MDYPGNLLNAVNTGCVLDLRMQLAIDFARAGLASDNFKTPAVLVADAVQVAGELVERGIELGWLEALPEGGNLPQPLVDHVKRVAFAQALGQIEGARVMQEAQGQMVRMPVGGMPLNG